MSGAELIVRLPGRGRVLFSARGDGNMSSVGGDGAADGARSRERLRERIGVQRLVRGHQVHGSVVARLSSPPGEQAGGATAVACDGQATALRGVGAMVLVADCLPVALGRSGAVAIVHAGWRGLAAGVLEQGVLAVAELGGQSAGGDGELVAIVGPGAGVCCYEVGEEVHELFGAAHRRGTNIDLRAIAHERLLAAGVSRVEHVRACTICDERFFSHRREGARAGRQAGVAWLS